MTDEKQRKRISSEMIVSVSAVVIGVCALAVSLYEAQLMRAQQRASVLPILELSRSHYTNQERTDNWRLLLQVENVGIGPAKIVDFVVTVDGAPKKTWGDAMEALLGGDARVRYGVSTIGGRTIPADRNVTMFDLSNTELTPDLVREFDRLDFKACYCSVFDECWTTAYSSIGGTQPVAACNKGDNSFAE